ncbi:Rpp14/Pop5 family protein [uncultured Methanospirillum sp.]|uniref:Rpp14/Pop5 family protein n=1 Tax=uncultured Methanospirillum sp. TaxID=262503 RepID=UPI0029C6778E|nr:Rpp14/Pop5 family protein [uncultured Methanospirillum sp.]
MRLRPSMRENYRYILTRVVSAEQIDAKDIYLAISDTFGSLFGEIHASCAWVAVMEYKIPYTIIRFRRGYEQKVEAALATITTVKGSAAAVHPVKTSGTIRTIREEIHKRNFSSRPGKVKINGEWFSAEIRTDNRIDLKEKGINPNIPLYITEEDIEDLHYDE